MKRRLSMLLVLFVGMGMMACHNPAKDKPKAVVGEPQQVVATAAGRLERIALKAGPSSVGFVGSKVTGSHPGVFQEFSGAISLADGKAEGGAVSVDIVMSSVKSDAEELDGHLKSADFFDVAKYPKATFESTSVKARGSDASSYTIEGNLTLHGVTKAIAFPATIRVTEQEVSASAEFSISRKDFAIVYPGKPNDLIRDEVLLKLDIKVPRQK